MATAMRVGANASKRGWKEYTKQLDNTWKQIEKTAGRSISTPESFFGALSKLGKRK